MQTYYTLSHAAGLIRNNKFDDKADAICVGTFRAETLALPVKIYEHKLDKETDQMEAKCVLVCMPDGSAKAPEGQGMETVNQNANDTSGSRNMDESYMLLSNYEEMPITTYYLKSELSEAQAKTLEQDLGVELGLYDSKTLHAYTEDSAQLRNLESKLAEASVEIESVKDAKVKKEKLEAATELVEAARKGHLMARSQRLPEFSVRASLKFGGGVRIQCHCEMVEGSDKSSPKIKVYADGRQIGEVKSEREASALMADYAQRTFAKFIKKELS